LDRRRPGTDTAKQLLGVGHRAIDQALEQAISRDALVATLPKENLPAPLIIFRLRDRITGTETGTRSLIVGLNLSSETAEPEFLLDWQLLQRLNALPLRRQAMKRASERPVDLTAIQQALAQAEIAMQQNIAKVDHRFQLPTFEVMVVLWPVEVHT
jgi:hypothetical protein